MHRMTLLAVSMSVAAPAAAGVTFSSDTPVSIDPDDSFRINLDITDLSGSYDSFLLTVDLDGDRPNSSEFDLDIRALGRTTDTVPFTQFLDDNNFSFAYDANDILTVEDPFMSTLIGGNYQTLRLTFFNDDSSRVRINEWSLTLVPAPSAVGVLAGAGLLASRRRRT
ncbi:MAG: hypothetical protein AAGG07_13225 [Planctomycetota bacterium]